MRWLDHRAPPPLVALIAAGLGWLLSASVPLADLSFYGHMSLAGALVLAGITVMVLGVMEFRKARTTSSPFTPNEASSLVRTGIYSYSRNPMYLGWATILLGIALYLARPLAFVGPLLFMLYINRFQIGPEERALEGLFGLDYKDYRGKVRRWL
jgi:protein-S-isoprenylcysteine O-methyltransferase Ste14